MSSDREKDIRTFLAAKSWASARRDPVAGDASTRRYERLTMGLEKAVLMDAPPAAEGPACPVNASTDERQALGYNAMARLAGPDPAAFVCLARELTRRGFSAPRILGADHEKGLILLEDLGEDRFAEVLQKHPKKEQELYSNAVSCLAAIYRSSFNPEMVHQNANWTVQDYDPMALQAEADLFLDWYAPAFDGEVSDEAKSQWHDLWADAFSHLNAHASGLALRDFHAENIFALPERDGPANVGLIDFQDALFAHPSYDLVSLLEDARRDVDPEIVPGLIAQFCKEAGIAEDDNFHAAYAVQAAQRNAKILGIFVRLAERDGKPHYTTLIPRVAAHFLNDLTHPALAGLRGWISEHTPSVMMSPKHPNAKPKSTITTAMVMAAGHGTRMRPLTDNTCKALVEVGGKALIDHMLDRLDEVGITHAVVNVHAYADQLEAHVKSRKKGPQIIISDERDELLETGGGLVKALPLLGSDPILICNIDAVWTEEEPVLQRLIEAWTPASMDELLMLAEIGETLGYHGKGDFETAFDFQLVRRRGDDGAPYVYAGVQIFKPELAKGFKQEKFSRNKIWDETLGRGKAFGYVMQGTWMHVGDPETLKEAEAVLKDAS
jgi:aminoglycoside/choline kinase family phosphotransferase/dTDP-glucose pyrophosphorylase